MKIYYIFLCLLINIFGFVNCNDDYIPVLFWTSPKIPDGPILELNKINRKLFTNYLIKKLSGTKALVLVFMEQILNVDDFHWPSGKTRTPFPFFTTINYRIRFFPYVEQPHEALRKLSSRGYKWIRMQTDWKLHLTDSSLIIMEFRGINNNERENTLKKHKELMAGITKELERTQKNWICVYTARQAGSTQPHISRPLSSWHIEPEATVRRKKPFYLYTDEVLGMAMLTKGPIQLHLPTRTNVTVKYLENYLGASFTNLVDTMDLVIWFTKYTLTFSMSLLKNDWVIASINVQKEDGQNIRLWPKIRVFTDLRDSRISTFQSKSKPNVKVVIIRYKVIHMHEKGSTCENQYTVPLLTTIMFIAIAFVSIVWTTLLQAYKTPVSPAPKTVQISFHMLSSRKATDLLLKNSNIARVKGNCRM